ncbi:hypothetical protein XH98_17145 [Bradyrhizobium sp. CCBAU 51745]|nr:hypothetical protein [Bradyrhizobium sp. CCBAU 51745]
MLCKDISSCATDESNGSFGAPGNSSWVVANCNDVTDPVAEIVAPPELYWGSMVEYEFRQPEAIDKMLALREGKGAFTRRHDESY